MRHLWRRSRGGGGVLSYPGVELELKSPNGKETRLDYAPPSVGQRIETRTGIFLVANVREVTSGRYRVRLERPPRDPLNLAADLLTHARNSVSQRERYRRNYIP
jgi:hypothetical protein